MAKAAIVLVGSELVNFSRPDTNGPYAKDGLAAIGIPVVWTARAGDKIEDIRETLRTALSLAEIVLVSGGLGPTGDDLTREGAAALLGAEVLEDAAWRSELERRHSARGRELTEIGRRQALVVGGGVTVPNPVGLACGCWLKSGGKDLVLLPGVPPEFQGMLDREVLPNLEKTYRDQPRVRTVRAVVAGIPESDAEVVLKPWYGKPGVDVSILPQRGVHRITFTLSSPPAEDLEGVESRARGALAEGYGDHLISLDGISLEERLGQVLLERGWSLATAESCTGGLIGHKIATVPGASRYFLGGIVAYDNEAKQSLLGVPPAVLEGHGAVSEETVLAMARGARARFNASCAIATTGVAGPTGGSPEKPAGTVWLAAATPRQEKAARICMGIDRESVMAISANYAMFHLWKMLGGEGQFEIRNSEFENKNS